MFSKLLELHILDSCSGAVLNRSQFGFIPKRGTDMAVTLAHDVCNYCVSRGSAVYLCSLDAAGAFDGIPHSVLLLKTMDILPSNIWKLMVYWYDNLLVHIKWGGLLGGSVPVKCGTRQGGLASPWIFNLFYKDLINMLSESNNGVTIKGINYNVYCYADDILISSTSVTGLQSMIDTANTYINQHGLHFNSTKTTCMIYGDNPFVELPRWTLDGAELETKSSLTYLGVELTYKGGSDHCQTRIRSAQKAYYSLQQAGLHWNGVSPLTAREIFTTGIKSVLAYGCSSIYLKNGDLTKMDKQQNKLLKSALGISHSCRSTPLLQALGITLTSTDIHLSELNLLKSCLLSDSHTSGFYRHMIKQNVVGTRDKTLYSRALNFAESHNIDLGKYIFNKNYSVTINKQFRSATPEGVCGIVDSLRSLLCNYSYRERNILSSLLKAF